MNKTRSNQSTFLLSLILLSCGFYADVMAQIIKPNHPVVICEPETHDTSMPQFNTDRCHESIASNIDPQSKEIWVKLTVDIDHNLLNSDLPIGFFIRGKASSVVYLNGQLIGNNGLPAKDAKVEIAGLMDTVFFIEKSLINQGQNELIMKMSAHKGFLTLGHPINWFGFDDYRNPTTSSLYHYWSSLLPFGAFVLAALYFGILTLHNKQRKSPIFLAGMAFFAATQLALEVSRGIVAYHYPFQDTRLLLILLCSIGFSISLFSHIVNKFIEQKGQYLIAVVLCVTFLIIIMISGFDLKTLLAILIPTLCAIGVSLYAWVKRLSQAVFVTAVLTGFAIVFFIDASNFLDTNFYYLVATLMALLFIQQALDHANEKKIRQQEKARADRLQLIIDQNRQKKQPGTIKVNSAGQVDIIKLDRIAYGKAAGDYVELVMLDNNSILHHGSMKKLEQDLPSLFLRVHRSYIVNTSQIQSLKRHSTGTGELFLANDHSIPVSRRIMPQVREQLV